jgi:hypothetical protein
MKLDNLKELVKEELDKETRKYTNSLNRGTIEMFKT